MLTEPLTMPPRKNLQMIYGVIVGLVFGANYAFGPIYSTPEMALVIGNLFAFVVSPKARLSIKLKQKSESGGGIVDFVFDKPRDFSFIPGQYMEWTLPHRGIDSRGNRRYFTLASSPTEDNIRLGVRFYDNPSSFKRALGELPSNASIAAGQLAGDFVLPADSNKKLVFIAGGIGITPFRSIIKYLLDKKETRDIVLLHILKTPQDAVYKDVFDLAVKMMSLKIVYVISDGKEAPKSWRGRVGHLTPEMITEEVPDFKDRRYYISGSHVMVTAGQDVLSKIGISKNNIVVDYFPGFV